MPKIVRLQSLTDAQVEQVKLLMYELNPNIPVTAEMIINTVSSEGTFFFALVEDEQIIGCSSLCVFYSPTGRKGHIEDVVVVSSYRGQGFGRQLMEYMIEYARKELKDIDIFLTSHPTRVAANNMYKSLGFCQRETNVYKMAVRDSKV